MDAGQGDKHDDTAGDDGTAGGTAADILQQSVTSNDLRPKPQPGKVAEVLHGRRAKRKVNHGSLAHSMQ